MQRLSTAASIITAEVFASPATRPLQSIKDASSYPAALRTASQTRPQSFQRLLGGPVLPQYCHKRLGARELSDRGESTLTAKSKNHRNKMNNMSLTNPRRQTT
ncbi:hypothetical protein VTL71DRAFT_1863 [Oculimacula yallundae]|uniref:Uncharacterized protein n=1 Tax=Oculimacula yallundae TaxID=86028 RepID=A0ABR4CBV8_9HELO